MKNKKGFTLIELLAVIVILAIIALIATPIILNMIENAKKGAAKDSAYGYIEAIENYQAFEMVKGNKGLIEGQYNISEQTLINNQKYEKLNNIINIKVKKKTSGTVGITSNGTVGTATICINDYIVEYVNNKATIFSDSCGDMGAIVTYNINSEKWETEKTLEILYPEGQYEYYYKLESGKAKVGEQELVIGEEIKLETNIINIELLENSKITAWLVKNGKKISIKTYEETKIDNVELGEVSATIQSNYPTLTTDGIKKLTVLEITYEEQEGTSAYYSVDGGNKWINYKEKINVSTENIKVKLMRDNSGKESDIVDATVSTASTNNFIPIEVYDGKESSFIQNNTTYVFAVDSSMWNKYMKVVLKHGTTGRYAYFKFYNSNGDLLETASFNPAATTTLYAKIPENTVKIQRSATNSNCIWYETSVYKDPVVNVENSEYPLLTSEGFKKGYSNVTLEYYETNNQKKYKIGDGEWQNYNNNKIKLEAGVTLVAKGINSDLTETNEIKYTANLLSDALPEIAYDGDETGEFKSNSTYYFNVDSSTWNK